MKIYTLNDEGERQVIDYVRAHGTDRVRENLKTQTGRNAWCFLVDTESTIGHLEMGGWYSRTGNPITTTFGPECFDCEELPD